MSSESEGELMAEPLLCITNYSLLHAKGLTVQPCVERGHHLPEFEENTAHARQCDGCLPRKAQHGFVCGQCFGRIEGALLGVRPWFQMLEGIDRAVQRDPVGGGMKPSIPIAPVPLAFDEVRSYFASFRGTAEQWVSNKAGARDAVRFAKVFNASAAAHPTAETAHKIKRTRCPRCKLLTLTWNPPLYFGAQVVVSCSNDECNFTADQKSFETLALIEKAQRRA